MAEDDRKLMFSNLVNGVPIDNVRHAFHASELEVQKVFDLVLFRIKAWMHKRRYPSLIVETIAEAQQKGNKELLLTFLPYIDLSKEPPYKKIITESADEKKLVDFRMSMIMRP